MGDKMGGDQAGTQKPLSKAELAHQEYLLERGLDRAIDGDRDEAPWLAEPPPADNP